jgi:T5SS/PEP-CTERM-associated repeat protein
VKLTVANIAPGTLTVNGAGSTLTIGTTSTQSGLLSIGSNLGEGTLTITNGGSVIVLNSNFNTHTNIGRGPARHRLGTSGSIRRFPAFGCCFALCAL